MRYYEIKTTFVVSNEDDPVETIDKWLRETVEKYEHPSHQFTVIETRKIHPPQR